ncbi:ABC transporter permease [Salinibacterium sp.]|uniref:ABC transporter permease n=1 Tax=Salinibacterium sp. TaxID=1915057 RepID=UPI00286C4FAD|nr:ABC transporter permease [Salinibacterium sp.]
MNTQTDYNQSRSERIARVSELPFIDASKSRGFVTGTAHSLIEIWSRRELISRLVRREIKARYKDSKLGVVWSLFRPLLQLVIYFFAIGQILGAARAVPDFAIFVFVGLTMWTLYAEIISGGARSIIDNAGLVKKVYLPREIFPLASIGSALFNFVIQLGVLLLAIAILSHYRLSPDLLLAPLALLTILTFGAAIGILVSAINVYLRDVQHFIEIYLIAFFWASPIVYPFTFVHKQVGSGLLEELYLASPITLSIIGAQKALWSVGTEAVGKTAQYWPDGLGLRLIVAFAVSLVLLWISQRIFAKLQGNFAQEL